MFNAELNEFLTRELVKGGYSGVEVLRENKHRIHKLSAMVQKRCNFDAGRIELYAERGSLAVFAQCIAEAESVHLKLTGGLTVRRACYSVLRFIMQLGAKLRGQRIWLNNPHQGLCNDYVKTANRHVLLRQGVLVIKIMLPYGPKNKTGLKRRCQTMIYETAETEYKIPPPTKPMGVVLELSKLD